jgi:hypothetical protein
VLGVVAIVAVDFELALVVALVASGNFHFDSARLANFGIVVLAATDSVVPDWFGLAVLAGIVEIDYFPADWRPGLFDLAVGLDNFDLAVDLGTDCNLVGLYLEAVVT